MGGGFARPAGSTVLLGSCSRPALHPTNPPPSPSVPACCSPPPLCRRCSCARPFVRRGLPGRAVQEMRNAMQREGIARSLRQAAPNQSGEASAFLSLYKVIYIPCTPFCATPLPAKRMPPACRGEAITGGCSLPTDVQTEPHLRCCAAAAGPAAAPAAPACCAAAASPIRASSRDSIWPSASCREEMEELRLL